MRFLFTIFFTFFTSLSIAQGFGSLEEINSQLPDDQKLTEAEYQEFRKDLEANGQRIDAALKDVEYVNVPKIDKVAAVTSEEETNEYTQGAKQLFDSSTLNSVPLRVREIEGLQLSEQWQEAYSKPDIGLDGRVVYHYGQSVHSVVCSIRNVCDIQLQPGEKVTQAPAIGDSIQWFITPGKTGEGENETVHIVVKPKNPGLHTSMIVFTDRRAYHFELKSTVDRHMSFVSFTYDQDIQADWAAIAASKKIQKIRAEKKILNVDDQRLSLSDLDFDYSLKGSADWKPLRVFNNATKTYIQFPQHVDSNDVPVFMAIKEGKQELMNYRFRNNSFIVDGQFSHGVLLSGVGGHQQKVDIIKNKVNHELEDRYHEMQN